jgi:hypothetical protein
MGTRRAGIAFVAALSAATVAACGSGSQPVALRRTIAPSATTAFYCLAIGSAERAALAHRGPAALVGQAATELHRLGMAKHKTSCSSILAHVSVGHVRFISASAWKKQLRQAS